MASFDANRTCCRKTCCSAVPARERSGTVADPAWRWDIDPARLADLLGLTRAESRIAVLLAQGKSIDEVAAETGLSRTTVKWHMRHIYAKNGISRQVELMRLVVSLGSLADDVPGARD